VPNEPDIYIVTPMPDKNCFLNARHPIVFNIWTQIKGTVHIKLIIK